MELPIITVCPINQTNSTALKLLGYAYWNKYAFHEPKNNSWGSLYNLTFEELQSKIYQVNIAKNVGFYNTGSIGSKYLFYLPVHGFCREISQYKPATDLFTYIDANKSQGGLQIFITDRNFKSHFSLDFRSQKGSPMIIPKFKRYAYVVDVEIDSSCNVSRASEMEKNNFNQCVDDTIQTHFGKPMGCVPPWMSLTNQCNHKYPNSYKEIIDDL